MKLTVIGHSLIAQRQSLFCEELRKLGMNVQEIFPAKWGALEREGGYKVVNIGLGMYGFSFEASATEAVIDFNPSIIYVMMEPISVVAYQSCKIAKKFGAKFVVFTWENLPRAAPKHETWVIENADLIVCGNKEAKEIMKKKGGKRLAVLPQTGVDINLFRNVRHPPKKWDFLYMGRIVPEKGIDYIGKACEGFSLRSGGRVPYEELPDVYSQAKIFITFPYEAGGWKEQSCGYTSLEALACEIPVITSDCGAIPEYLGSCPSVYIAPERDLEVLKEVAHKYMAFSEDEMKTIGIAARVFIEAHYSNQVIGTALLEALTDMLDVER